MFSITYFIFSLKNIENEQNSGEDKKIVKYARTPLMSTYLIAFVVGDLEYIEVRGTFFRSTAGCACHPL